MLEKSSILRWKYVIMIKVETR